jgi:hypothetical protein
MMTPHNRFLMRGQSNQIKKRSRILSFWRIMKNSEGFTAIEMIAYIGILTIVLGIVTFYIMNIIRNENIIGDRVRMIDEADFAMRQILDNIRGSIEILPDPESTFVKSDPPCSACVLALAQGNDTRVTFSVNTGVLEIYNSSEGTTKKLTSPRVSVDRFSFKCAGGVATCIEEPKAVQIEIWVRDIKTQFTEKLISGAIPRGF